MKNISPHRGKADPGNIFHLKREEETAVFSIDNHLMSSQGTHGCFEGVKLEGRNAGATLIARQSGRSGGSQDCCSINIYICNNVQGVNNSVLIGSKVKQGDPGVRLTLKGLKLDKGFKKKQRRQTRELVAGICWITLLFALLAMIFLF
ncbi:OLC1v1006910C1 [Oldenlandia corymbosa var. corymbosa]|uniref:OLC1v1006910C1 n=1 Tax=Oldenlandia corymbosa var. corymbosa TaxID=529605 RepID=A0AAV1DL59_OLDCO|nr:OLC1v1006910C1 [Oldenlandia corymbosa var. corymbosa]